MLPILIEFDLDKLPWWGEIRSEMTAWCFGRYPFVDMFIDHKKYKFEVIRV